MPSALPKTIDGNMLRAFNIVRATNGRASNSVAVRAGPPRIGLL